MNDALSNAVVANGLTCGVNSAVEYVIRCGYIRPNGFQDFVFGHHTFGVTDEKYEQVENFRLDVDRGALLSQGVKAEIDFERAESIQGSVPARMALAPGSAALQIPRLGRRIVSVRC